MSKRNLGLLAVMFVLVLGMVWNGNAQAGRGASGAQRWEYLVEPVPTVAVGGGFMAPEKAMQEMNAHGAQGWELVLASHGMLVYKRAR
ncbi:hypothetical protein Acid345_1091 [Candidatus Koribacter versatilis Ellin345]|uniref:DUF4177 domain-containing protein n=1 Tax=Koribacter versatilis (strain Ellin345) TaxID=204669 RepID=Q1ISQ6_KORVE|nr:DUF4177 domain-containing protein [Candidatus Koribacter versatilis]ABF40094.1 hypothetical protein Acid345_1091 [Candidatus Koribacter versatilis Ellin345]